METAVSQRGSLILSTHADTEGKTLRSIYNQKEVLQNVPDRKNSAESKCGSHNNMWPERLMFMSVSKEDGCVR